MLFLKTLYYVNLFLAAVNFAYFLREPHPLQCLVAAVLGGFAAYVIHNHLIEPTE